MFDDTSQSKQEFAKMEEFLITCVAPLHGFDLSRQRHAVGCGLV